MFFLLAPPPAHLSFSFCLSQYNLWSCVTEDSAKIWDFWSSCFMEESQMPTMCTYSHKKAAECVQFPEHMHKQLKVCLFFFFLFLTLHSLLELNSSCTREEHKNTQKRSCEHARLFPTPKTQEQTLLSALHRTRPVTQPIWLCLCVCVCTHACETTKWPKASNFSQISPGFSVLRAGRIYSHNYSTH